ncbi:cytochrome C556 [Idiomarina piscisalsi]|jgi:cytochrome c556|uniref:Cytochrome C556 n=1 Tax=Idiomarina piscisalsi TaxID=1096243 RepID=A0ABM6LSB3_9GAMM|nr:MULTISPECIES: cytochrome c [Idiomarina]ASG65431.1 cytochrome C556 [Idiomarina piscisalsi]RXS42010.1 cytochrome c [Idiomarina sp. 29L]
MKKSLSVLFASVALSLSASTIANEHAFNDGEKAVEYRQKALSIMQQNFAAMAEMVKGEVNYDAQVFTNRAKDFESLAGIPWSGFAVEGAMPGDNTDALTAIWDNWEDFQQRSNDLQQYASELAVAAETGSMDNIKPVFMNAAQTCKGCHDEYKD